ncbi:hypothetical protein [Nitrososphaera sp.]|uniref:hypothetical protein n=1 Tax=Nitrososphaera sp. TaxID=1971748 RepID=UPI003172BD21
MNTSTLEEFEGRRTKYRNPDYNDDEVEGLMRYFSMTDYIEFVDFIRRSTGASAGKAL